MEIQMLEYIRLIALGIAAVGGFLLLNIALVLAWAFYANIFF